MTNAHDPINTTSEVGNNGEIIQGFGLTKREYFASLAMQGIVSQFVELPASTFLVAPKNIAEWSVVFADELIKSLNEQK